jgi:hypothetical protein
MKILLPSFLLCLASFSMDAEELLLDKMRNLDAELFGSFNKCHEPNQLEKHATYFSPNVEFYHDNGGVTWSREEMLKNTKANACGNFSRKLIESTFRAYPVKDYGAITEGVHVFCQSESQKCEGKADFVMVWQYTNEKWRVTRVLSYGHKEND